MYFILLNARMCVSLWLGHREIRAKARIQLTKQPGPEVIKYFSCSTQQSTTFQLLIKTKISTNEEVYSFTASLSDVVFIMLINVKMHICWLFIIYEQD